MGKECSFFDNTNKWLKRIGFATIAVTVIALIRFLSLEFTAIRWTLLVFWWMFISSCIEDMKCPTLCYFIELPLNYIVAGFLFGYRKINAFIGDHWILFLVWATLGLAFCIASDLSADKKKTSQP